MRRYAFFGGSFNPPTIAHKELAVCAKNEFNLDKVFFVPVGDFYPKPELISIKHRINMLEIMCENLKDIEILPIEQDLNFNLKAIDVFKLIKSKYKHDQIYFIMGADNFVKILSWKDSKNLIENYKYIILNRNDMNLRDIIQKNKKLNSNEHNFYIMQNQENFNVSSSMVRGLIKRGEKNEILRIVDRDVFQYIMEHELYNFH